MRHYHGSPIGGTRARAEEFCEGRHILIPWKRPEDLERAMDLSRGFIVDNSAFTFWTTKETPHWPDYCEWVREFDSHPRYDFGLIMDVIDGTEELNDALIELWKSRNVKRGCPVWHLHESLDRLKRLCNEWEYVAFGSSGQWPNPGQGDWWHRMDEAMEVATDGRGYPLARLHGLRMLRQDIIEAYPWASCDSTNAVQNGTREAAKNGVDACWGRMTIARRIERSQSPSRWIKSQQMQFELTG